MDFTNELFESICDEIAYSDKGLVSICSDKGLNARRFYEWIAKDADLSHKYTRARELQADFLADQIIEISNTPKLGTKTVDKPTGIEVTEGDMIDHRRLQVDARKWKASKLYPKKYADRVDSNVTITDAPDIIAPGKKKDD